MQANNLSMVLTVSFILSVLGCTPPSSSSAPGNTSDKKLYLGDLDKKVNELYSDENEVFFTSCEKKNKSIALEIGRFLEENRSQIDAFYKDYLEKNPSKNVTIEKFDKFSFQKYQIDEESAKDTWSEFDSSWDEASEIYAKIKAGKIDVRWVQLNFLVRGMVPDEESRLQYGWNMSLSKDAGSAVNSIYEKLNKCNEDSSCLILNLTEDEKKIIANGGFENYYQLLLTSQKLTSAETRKAISKMTERFKYYKDRYGFRNSELASIKSNTLEIPMDLSAFGNAANKFSEYVESIWNTNATHNIKIISKPSSETSYLVKISELTGGRSYVAAKIMQLYNMIDIKTLAHEFGHIIGFRDNYYTTWSVQTCKYTYQSNSGDIMSNSSNGKVLEKHWDEIKKNYFK